MPRPVTIPRSVEKRQGIEDSDTLAIKAVRPTSEGGFDSQLFGLLSDIMDLSILRREAVE